MRVLISFVYLSTLLSIGFIGWRACLDPALRSWANLRFAVVIPLIFMGMLGPDIWTYYAAVFLAVALLPRSRAEAVCLFLTTSFMLPLITFVPFIGTARLVDLSTVSVGSLGLLAALRFPRSPHGVRGWSRVDLGFAGLIALSMVILLRIPDVSVTTAIRTFLVLSLSLIIPYLAISRLATEPDGLRRVLHTMAMIGFTLSIVALFEMVRHWPLYGAIDHHLGTSIGRSRTLAIRGGLLRAPGPFAESTGFGVFLALTTTILAANGRLFRSRQAHTIAVLVGCSGSFATLARNGWIGLAVGLMLIGVYRGRNSVITLVVLAAGAGLYLAVALAPDGSTLGALLGSSGHAESTAQYREDLLKYGFALYRQHALTGLPIGEANTILEPVLRSGFLDTDWVNSYLFFAVGTGTLGLLTFVFYVLAPVIVTLAQRRVALGSTLDVEAATAVFAGGVGMAIMSFFLSYSERLPLMAIVLAGSARQLQARLAGGGTRGEAKPGGAKPGEGTRGDGTRAAAPRAVPAMVVDPTRPVWRAPTPALAEPRPGLAG